MKASQKFLRGQVWICDCGDNNTGENVINGLRPVLIISDDSINKNDDFLIVLPLSSKSRLADMYEIGSWKFKNDYSTVYEESNVLACQIKTISGNRLSRYMFTFNEESMTEICDELLKTLGIPLSMQAKHSQNYLPAETTNVTSIKDYTSKKSTKVNWTKKRMERFITDMNTLTLKEVTHKYKIAEITAKTYYNKFNRKLKQA